MLNFPGSWPPLGGPRDGPTVFLLCLGAGLLRSDIWLGYSGQMQAKRSVSDSICGERCTPNTQHPTPCMKAQCVGTHFSKISSLRQEWRVAGEATWPQ